MSNLEANKTYNLEKILENIKQEKIYILYFETTTCGVCTVIKGKLQEMLEKFPAIKVAYLNVDTYPDIAARYNFFMVPGIIIFVEGKETIRQARFINVKEIEEKLHRIYGLLS